MKIHHYCNSCPIIIVPALDQLLSIQTIEWNMFRSGYEDYWSSLEEQFFHLEIANGLQS